MVDDAVPDEPITAPTGRNWPRWIFGAAVMLLLLLFAIAWWQRISIAERFAQQQIEEYGVRATYTIKDIGLRTQRLENVVIGDPANPDLTADWIELDISLNFTGVTLRDVRAAGVKLRGKYADGKLSFGELDKFTDPESKEPFKIPDIGVELADAQMRLDTPWGAIGAGLDGSGLLRQRFEGNLALRAPALQYGDCSADAARFDGRYLLDSRQPNLIGPWLANSINCKKAGIAATRPGIDGELRLSEQFDRWFGNVNFAAKALNSGDFALAKPRGMLSFDGKKERTNFDGELKGAGYQSAPLDIRNLIASAQGHFDISDAGISVTARGDADLVGGKLANAYISDVDAVAANARETPVGPLLARMAPALRRAVADFDGRLRYDASIGAGGQSVVLVDGMALRTRSGARASQSGVVQLRSGGNGWRLVSPLQLAMSGGDLPALNLALRGDGGRWAGDLSLDRYAAGKTSLAVSRLAFSGFPGGVWNFDGRAQLTGPIPGGFVTGLDLPVNGRWDGSNASLYQSCQNFAFESLQYSGLSLGKQNIRACPQGGSMVQAGQRTRVNATLPGLAIRGSYDGSRLVARSSNVRFNLDQGFVVNGLTAEWGDSPIRVATPVVRFSFKDGFDSDNVRVETGDVDALTYFDIAQINGAFTRNGLSGRLSGAAGQIANVPIIMSNAAGPWSMIGGDLKLEAGMQISDAEQVDRFKMLNIPDALVTFEDGIINALGTITEPKTGATIADLDIRHILSSGDGRALFSVDSLIFNDRLQPEMITPLTLGVVSNVQGGVYGDGQIVWDSGGDGIRSTGKFGTKKLNLSAAFGPVAGLNTEMQFTDLLSLQTAPGQVALIDYINPGIAALGGKVNYRLLADQMVEIEGGRWPFAGGELVLEPTIWDFGIETPRKLVFTVRGVEIARFLDQFELDNLNATGIFDGVLPMVFDSKGGRITGGELVSREGGGNISYIGDLTYADLSPYANFAFDALRSLDYSRLRLGMDGDLAGEIITVINFTGVKQGKGAKQNFITRQLAKIPIEFNLTIEAQFFELIGSVRGYYDPSFLVQRNLPELLRRQEEYARRARELKAQIPDENTEKAEQPVQPSESKGGL